MNHGMEWASVAAGVDENSRVDPGIARLFHEWDFSCRTLPLALAIQQPDPFRIILQCCR